MIAQTRPFACRAPRSSTATSTAGMSASATTSFSSSTRPKRPKRTWPPGTTRPRCSPKPAARAAQDERSLPSSRLTRISVSSTRTHPSNRGSWRPNPVRNPRGRKKYFFVLLYICKCLFCHSPTPTRPRRSSFSGVQTLRRGERVAAIWVTAHSSNFRPFKTSKRFRSSKNENVSCPTSSASSPRGQTRARR